MPAKTNKTGAVVLPQEQWDALKHVASIRVLTGKATRSSASEVLREVVAQAMPALLDEIEAFEKGTRR